MKLIDLFNEILKEADDFKITRDGGGRVASKIANIGKQLTPGFIRSPKEYKGIGGAKLSNKNVEDAASSIEFRIPRSRDTESGGKKGLTDNKTPFTFSSRGDYKGFQYIEVKSDDLSKIKEIFSKDNTKVKTYGNMPNLITVEFNETSTDKLYTVGKLSYYAKTNKIGIIYTPNTYDLPYLSDLDVEDVVDKNNYKKFQFTLKIINLPN
jgi:hypothetical protein